MADELISRETVLEDFEKCNSTNPNWTPQRVKTLLVRQPTVDAVSRGVYEQIKWERDVAMEQLEEYGIAFGAKKQGDAVEVVRCFECAIPHNKWTGCPKLGGLVTPPDFYCGFGERKEDNATD